MPSEQAYCAGVAILTSVHCQIVGLPLELAVTIKGLSTSRIEHPASSTAMPPMTYNRDRASVLFPISRSSLLGRDFILAAGLFVMLTFGQPRTRARSEFDLICAAGTRCGYACPNSYRYDGASLEVPEDRRRFTGAVAELRVARDFAPGSRPGVLPASFTGATKR